MKAVLKQRLEKLAHIQNADDVTKLKRKQRN